jgi:hypothetical protein
VGVRTEKELGRIRTPFVVSVPGSKPHMEELRAEISMRQVESYAS